MGAGMEGPTRRNAICPLQVNTLLLLSSVLLVGGLGGVEEVDKTCQSHETCMPNCKLFKVMITCDGIKVAYMSWSMRWDMFDRFCQIAGQYQNQYQFEKFVLG